jgi:hypothetical protein
MRLSIKVAGRQSKCYILKVLYMFIKIIGFYFEYLQVVISDLRWFSSMEYK